MHADRAGDILLDVQDLRKHYPLKRGLLKSIAGQVKAVDGVSFRIRKGETVALVGESGCGKTTTARCIVGAIAPTGGRIAYYGDGDKVIDLARLKRSEWRPLRAQIQMIFQDPYSSLDPRMTLLDIVGEPLLVHGMKDRPERIDRVAELLRLVGLRPEYMRRFPHAFSGGQRQRIGIARALALNPNLVVADEAVSALDVSVQAQILNLLLDLQERLGLTYLFVAHDLSVVKHISDRVVVMYAGKIVESAPTDEIFAAQKHPYTEALLAAVPKPNPRLRSRRPALQGEVADAANLPSGCHFHPRCRYAIDICKREAPPLMEAGAAHVSRCHRAQELTLQGLHGTG